MNNSTKLRASHVGIPTPGRHQGFTFIEIMIAVTIVGILAALALPSYGNYVREARRGDGHLALLHEAQMMERCRSTSWSYADCDVSSDESNEKYYDIEVESTATSYMLTATATGAQANDSDCSPLTLDHLGDQKPADCWRK